MIRTRFAPSPTGFVHVGSLRTALFPYLFAKKNGGSYIVRIEDTDKERQVEGSIENLLRMLDWVGIKSDEGPRLNDEGKVVQVGDHGPYVQSERLPIYQKYVAELLKTGAAYYAFDTSEELDAMRERQRAMKQPPKYERKSMRNQFTLGDEETKKLVAEGASSFVIRMKVPDEGIVTFNDLVHGEMSFSVKEIDDQVLIKSDGFPTYHLAVVVDDHLMEITHVIRGEDWLPSTPKHVLLYQAFGWDVPVHAHLPLLVDKDKRKLSKRMGDVSVESYREKGYLSDAFVNFIAFLGWNPGDEREIFSKTELIEAFSLERIQKNPAFFNVDKLNWFNQQYLRKLTLDELIKVSKPFLGEFIESSKMSDTDWLGKAISVVRDRVVVLSDLPDAMRFLFVDKLKYDSQLLVWKKSDGHNAKIKLELILAFLANLSENVWDAKNLEEKIGEWIKGNNLTNGEVLWPLRVALSGAQNSPGPYDLAGVLGKEAVLERIKMAIELLSK